MCCCARQTAKRVSDAFKKLSQSTRALAGDVREIFENNLPFITKKMERLVHLVNTSGEDSNKAIAKYNKEFMLRKVRAFVTSWLGAIALWADLRALFHRRVQFIVDKPPVGAHNPTSFALT